MKQTSSHGPAGPSKLTTGERAKLAAAIHARNEFEYGECDHGVYSGGPSHGEPYATCERLADPESIVVAAVEEIAQARADQAAAAVVIDVAAVLDGYDFAGNALAKAVCEGYRDMIRARLSLHAGPSDTGGLISLLTGSHFCEVEPSSGIGSHLNISPHEAEYLAQLITSRGEDRG